MEAYYKQYQQSFQEADVFRLVLPLNAATENGKPIDPAAAKTLTEELRGRVLAGDEFDDLQARAYKEMGITAAVPHTNINLMNRPGLSPEEAKVFEMDLGETTPVFENQGVLVILLARPKTPAPQRSAHTDWSDLSARPDPRRASRQDTGHYGGIQSEVFGSANATRALSSLDD